MWKCVAKSVQGSGHKRLGTVCQDACLTSIVPVGDQQVLILIASDGAGSAEHSDIGAQMACDVIQTEISQHIERMAGLQPIDREVAIGWYQAVRSALEAKAESLSVSIRQLACTLIVAVIGESSAAFCQVGDGAIVIRGDTELRPVFWPQAGEYANSTNFVASSKIDQDLMFEWHAGRIGEIAMFTDGLQSVALNFATRQAHQPFFNPLLDAVRNHPDPAELLAPMQSFLESKNLADRTDDDLTLILAVRAIESLQS